MAKRVWITDVAPRDGLQAEHFAVPVDQKAALALAVAATGVDAVEVTSFVSPKWIPQLGDAAEVCAALAAHTKAPDRRYIALVPNERGLDRLLEVNDGGTLIDTVAVFTAASETFSQRNTNATIDETIDRFRPVIERARAAGLATRGYVSCVIACPFEGAIAPSAVAAVAERLKALGIEEIDLGDTIGAGKPESVRAMLASVREALGEPALTGTGWPDRTLHLHDTFGRAADCVVTALHAGVRSFDAAVGGLGGCPYASTPDRRAPGNIDLFTLVETVESEGYTTGIDRSRLAEASRIADRVARIARGDGVSA